MGKQNPEFTTLVFTFLPKQIMISQLTLRPTITIQKLTLVVLYQMVFLVYDADLFHVYWAGIKLLINWIRNSKCQKRQLIQTHELSTKMCKLLMKNINHTNKALSKHAYDLTILLVRLFGGILVNKTSKQTKFYKW